MQGIVAILAVTALMLSGVVAGDDRHMAAQDPLQVEIARLAADEQAPLRDFYAARAHRPAWVERRKLAAFAESLQTLEGDGLDPGDYRADRLVAEHRRLEEAGAAVEARARFDLQATRVLLAALHHLQRGRLDPREVDPDWEVPIEAPPLDPAMISRAVDGQRFEQAFAEARPDFAPYERLRSGLARYRNIQRLGGWPPLPDQPRVLRPGDEDEAVAMLRERLAMEGALEVMVADAGTLPGAALEAPPANRYDAPLEAAVRRFQRRHLLEVDGIVGPQTRAALNVPVEARIDQIRVNLERARWLLHGLPEAFVLVDIAGYQISYFRPSGEIWRSRIVVGRPYRRTPSLRSEITHMTVNPTWTVPPTILREDVLPRVRRDIGYLWRERLQVLSPSGRPLDPWEVDWQNPGNIMLRQAAGPRNALGQVVIRFPNDHLVYLHDTPAQGLFAREQRAFSSGCIRVQGVLEFAQLLFDDTGSDQDVRSLVASGETRNVSLASRMPVILHYWTVHADEDGELAFRPDIYERDGALLRALDRPLAL
ncbi:murein L,D-transpeptidase YcbB/YkuD [Halomonas campaniensis]|uniref:Murein L,D-transpeptidase YcbB/YkuD n=1 Tax=Halomonas campaniensis TaxID=213554 RepID=A0A7W5K4P7_9GAMM|nr:L,D-transpeptidase family protein [Halomonas campaniensis]MBB3331292.1 murein L,D-transpeptidase YcbB/YkuD [Halomonas campaniensis]